MRLFAVLVAAMVAAAMPAMPVSRFDQIENPQPKGIAECPGGQVMVLAFEKAGVPYEVFAGLNGSRFVLIDSRPGDDLPAWVGTIDKEGGLHVEQALTFGDLVAKYPQICSAFGVSV